ncbi:neither inactivation nor afterpotential D [Musca autumnalis]|uniref:neither inactivation nor afterpotential D n=1 Tax=Musca autumnalis TaxID=221902 RepID=UPI003CEE4314
MCSIAVRERLKYMCCRCCSKTQQKIWVFGIASMFLILGLVGMIWGPSLLQDVIYKQLPLTEGGRTYDKWINTPVPVYMAMYLYNWTNTDQVRVAGVKPNFERVGPYVFREERIKNNITFYPNNTVSFMPQRMWYFEPEMSGGTLEDNITCPHLPTIAASNIARGFPRIIKIFFNMALNSNGGALYQTHTANEWLFQGFYDQFLDYAMKLNNSMTGNIKDNHFAWFLHRNGSRDFEGIFTINTGKEDLREMGELKFWNGMNNTGFFEGECGRINGSTSDLFVPNRGPEEWITIYMKDTCRIINLVPSGKNTIEGIEGIRYETKPDTYDSGDLNPDMKCYCPPELMPDNCPKHGVTDIRSCSDGAPMFMSHPGFLYADPSYANTTTGTRADPEKDVFFITIEPKLGVPLEVNAAIQISLHIQPDKDITLLKNIPSFYAPLFTINSIAKMTPEVAKEVQFALNVPSIGLYMGIGMTCLAVLIASVGVYVTLTKKWYEPIGDERTIIDHH